MMRKLCINLRPHSGIP